MSVNISLVDNHHHPDDVLLEILSKLPIRSLLRFQCVSKSWRSLISDPQSHKKLPPAMAGLFSAGASPKFVSLASRSFVDPSTIDSGLSFLPEPRRILGVCNGLLLLSNPNSLFVCNPATRKRAKIPKPPRASIELALAFNPNSDTRSFKIVSFPLPGGDPVRRRGSDEVDVFSSDTGSWSTVGGIAGLSEGDVAYCIRSA
ncbi:putative F-box protein At4g38870 isoform X2 [Asparagus officinalis]|uniref:putative F-box protein At4g38870 isoform X2 n=1 Tax=Asparagus officinalis TaxID=4686 RepID=UPI00098E71B3|nr:putative F-box protein At4g38870 isoform X2 [Asparagus officinalis]